MNPTRHLLKQRSRYLRKKMTNAESLLWQRVRRKQILGIQFYRQRPIGMFIVDFYAPAAGLVVEIDGSQHYESHGKESDGKRDQLLAQRGLYVLRFHNLQVLKETDQVVEKVFQVVEQRLSKSIHGNPP